MLANTLIVVFWVFKQKQKIFIHMVDIKKLQKGLKQIFLLWVIISICLLVGFTQIHRITFIEVCSTWRTGLAQSPGHNIVTGKKKKKEAYRLPEVSFRQSTEYWWSQVSGPMKSSLHDCCWTAPRNIWIVSYALSSSFHRALGNPEVSCCKIRHWNLHGLAKKITLKKILG